MKFLKQWWWGVGCVVLAMASNVRADSVPLGATTVSTGTATYSGLFQRYWVNGASNDIVKITVTMTSSDQGNCTVALPSSLSGEIVRIATNPAGGGSAPSDDYDITWTDQDGMDLLATLGGNRDTATTENFCPMLSTYNRFNFWGATTITATNMGDTNTTALIIYLRR